MHENDAHEQYDPTSLIRSIFNWIESEFQNIFNRQKEPKYFFLMILMSLEELTFRTENMTLGF